MLPTTRTKTYGDGLERIGIGWRFTNSLLTSPELNPTERLSQYTRRNGTHNRYFSEPAELVGTLTRVFGEIQRYPELIRPSLVSFC
jgi:hypothetical protein